MAEEFVGEPQIVVQGQNSHSLKTDHDDLQRGHNRKHILNYVQCPYRQQRNLLSIFNIPDLNHPHKALWVFLKDRQKGIDRQSEDSGHFCRSRWDSFIRSLVTLKYRNVQTCELCRVSRICQFLWAFSQKLLLDLHTGQFLRKGKKKCKKQEQEREQNTGTSSLQDKEWEQGKDNKRQTKVV